MDDDLTRVHDVVRISLVNLPAELLVKILSYLPTRDKINVQYVSRRLNDVSETPLLWKKFLWHDYEPRHVPIVSNTLKAHGKHVRQVFFPAHVTPAKILEMVQYCTELTHLSLPRRTQLSLHDHDMEKILHITMHLQQLDIFISSIQGKQFDRQYDHEEQFLKIITAMRVKSLILRIDWLFLHCYDYKLQAWLNIFERFLNGGHTLPSVINLLIIDMYCLEKVTGNLQSWSPTRNTQASFQISLYDIARVPMDIYPSISLRRFQFGPAASPPLIKFSDHGMLGLEDDMFYLSDYDHYGEVRHSVMPKRTNLEAVENEQLHWIEQLAIACPNLHRLNLENCDGSLRSLQGLRAIVDTCKNLQGLNLVAIPVSQVESYLHLWELLSSVKKLTHLAIGLCMLTRSSKCDDADKQKLIGILRRCGNLKALEVSVCVCHECLSTSNLEDFVFSNFPSLVYDECQSTSNVEDFMFSNFPSLVYVKMTRHTECTSMLKYAVANCRQLKYLCCEVNLFCFVHQLDLPSSINCGLQQLCIEAYHCVQLSTSFVQVLSAHGELEKVTLFVKSITTCAITTLIANSPNLILLHLVFAESLSDDNGARVDREDYMDTVSKTFPCHKLLTAGDFSIRLRDYNYKIALSHYNTNLNSLWTPYISPHDIE